MKEKYQKIYRIQNNINPDRGDGVSKYKCPEPSCKNKEKYDEKGFCPECGKKLRKTTNILPIIGIGALLLIGLLVVGALTVPTTNTTTNTTPSTQKVVEPEIKGTPFENEFFKFTVPEGYKVKEDAYGNVNLTNPKYDYTIDGEKYPAIEISIMSYMVVDGKEYSNLEGASTDWKDGWKKFDEGYDEASKCYIIAFAHPKINYWYQNVDRNPEVWFFIGKGAKDDFDNVILPTLKLKLKGWEDETDEPVE